MSITEAILQDMDFKRQRNSMRDHYNAITTTEVEMEFDKAMTEIRTLESYLSCFEREWDVDLRDIRAVLNSYRSKIDDEKICFINNTYMIGR